MHQNLIWEWLLGHWGVKNGWRRIVGKNIIREGNVFGPRQQLC